MNRRDVVRVVDANLNRAREALRVIEECSRFGRAPGAAFEAVRSLRHRMSEIESAMGLSPSELADARDPAGDPGRAMPAGPHESLAALAAANCRRMEEAFRAIEEFGRLLGADCCPASSARFEAYEIGKSLLPGLDTRRKLGDARLCVLLNGSAGAERIDELARASIEGGADMIKIRGFDSTDSEALDLCSGLAATSLAAGVIFVVGGRPDICVLSGANGVFLEERDLAPEKARTIVGWHSLIGVWIRDLDPPTLNKVDYVLAGPVFPALIGAEEHFIGPENAARLCLNSPVPAFAAGGINGENVFDLASKGVRRVAVSTGVTAAKDPAGAVSTLKKALEGCC